MKISLDLRGTKIFIPKIRGMKICTEKIRGRKTLPTPEKMLRAGSAPDKCPVPYLVNMSTRRCLPIFVTLWSSGVSKYPIPESQTTLES